MRWRAPRAGWILLPLVVVGWGFILFSSNERPDAVRRMAGCFRAPGFPGRPEVKIDESGAFIAAGFRTPVTVEKDKMGLSLVPKLPERRILMENFRNLGPVLESGYPQKIRIHSNGGGFAIPDRNGYLTSFERVQCRG